nr:hypothetical protein CFP56_53588 [Quercus suber]
MPIVDGLTSTKMIRSHEKAHPSGLLSSRAALNGRVPIIAVSASLVEKERPNYSSAGFDGWILKPIAFDRLSVIMNGLVQKTTRKENLYGPGRWDLGGWFQESSKDVFSADTTPSGEAPIRGPEHGAQSIGVEVAATVDKPEVKEEDDSTQTQEQQRLLHEQAAERGETPAPAEPNTSPSLDATDDDTTPIADQGVVKENQPPYVDGAGAGSSGEMADTNAGSPVTNPDGSRCSDDHVQGEDGCA